jgi:hypothetical protein
LVDPPQPTASSVKSTRNVASIARVRFINLL